MKKIIKNLSMAFIIVFVILTGNINVKAATYPVGYGFINSTGYSYTSAGNKTSMDFGNVLHGKNFGKLAVYYIVKGGLRHEAYCYEPGVYVPKESEGIIFSEYNTYPSDHATAGTKLNAAGQLNLKKVLTYAALLPSMSPTQFNSKIAAMDLSSTPARTESNKLITSKIIAAQALIWELSSGERTTFTYGTYKPNQLNVFHADRSNTSFCSAFLYGEPCGTRVADKTQVTNEYMRIVNMVSTDNLYPFANNTVGKMVYTNSKYMYTVNVSNNSFTNCTIKATNDGNECTIYSSDPAINLQVTSSNQLLITTNKPISSSSPASVVYRKPVSSATTIKYYDTNNSHTKNYQGVAIPTPGNLVALTLKLHTPTYFAKIKKVDKVTRQPLEGAKFNLYSDFTCKTKISEGVSDSNGIVTFSGITTPTVAYAKEITAPDGYIGNILHTPVPTSTTLAGSEIIEIDNFPIEIKVVKMNNELQKITQSSATFTVKRKSDKEKIYFTKDDNKYSYVSESTAPGAIEAISTIDGELNMLRLPAGTYILTEVVAPEDYQLPLNPNTDFTVGKASHKIIVYNGLEGQLIFEKINEDSNYVQGGIFSLQRKIRNIYYDVGLKKIKDGIYEYLENPEKPNDYEMTTRDGIAIISKLPTGEYRVVEKQAPDGYDTLADVNVPKVTILDDGDPKKIRLVNTITLTEGSQDSAKLIIAITTGRAIKNYAIIIGLLVVAILTALFIKKKIK